MDIVSFENKDISKSQINEEARRKLEVLLNEGIADSVSYSEDEVYHILGIDK